MADKNDDFLNILSGKEEIKDAGTSPFAKKKKEAQKVVRISEDCYEKARLIAFNNHSSISEELNKMINDGYELRKQKEDKND